MPTEGQVVDNINDQEQIKMQFDYAWKWFDFHARQRTTMFNFFLIFAGFILTAIGQIFRAKHPDMFVAMVISAIGSTISLLFWGLDVRNGRLIAVGELYLRYFEINLFNRTKGIYFQADPDFKVGNQTWRPRSVGSFSIKDYIDKSENFPRQNVCKTVFDHFARHRVLNPLIILTIAIVFGAGAVYFFVRMGTAPSL